MKKRLVFLLSVTLLSFSKLSAQGPSVSPDSSVSEPLAPVAPAAVSPAAPLTRAGNLDDATARLLAGLPVRDTALASLGLDPAWADHATEFDRAWQQLERRQLARIREWAPEFMPAIYEARAPLFYMFSGPDFLYAQAFFPNASTYVLCGIEPVGPIPRVTEMTPARLAAALGGLRKSLNSVLNFSFFITKDMKVDLRETELTGTLPVLFVFLARSGGRIEGVDLVGLDKAGHLTTEKAVTPGARIRFFGPSGAEQTLYYFSSNLANDGIKANPAFMKFCDQLGAGSSFVKAASYLMHIQEFSRVRDFLLSHSKAILEDDSGIPLRDFDRQKWLVRFFGSYPGPIEIFKQYTQPDLAAAVHDSHSPALPFGVGYRYHPSESTLILATEK